MGMFDDDGAPRVFALPCGTDFPRDVIAGLRMRLAGQAPEAIARVTLIVNSARMKRRLIALFQQDPPGFLPRISLLTSLSELPEAANTPRPVSRLRRRLELVQVIAELLDRQPELAARSSAFDLADSLANLMEEMQDENVPPAIVGRLDVSDQSRHWARTQLFLEIAEQFIAAGDSPDSAGHQRKTVEALCDHWERHPPRNPVIVAGSTGSRGTTLQLMRSVSRLPQGALILPGFDFDQPPEIWRQMRDDPNEDHPQFRFVRIMETLEISLADVLPWIKAEAPVPARNRLMSLAFRPAPVTDAWMSEGPKLADLDIACGKITLIEAPNLREEALAIAMGLRQAAETGTSAALITPDRMLARRVATALQRWDILPDNAAGTPLNQTAAGRFLRQLAVMQTRQLDAVELSMLLKHPFCHSGKKRRQHLRLARDLELWLRRAGKTSLRSDELAKWAKRHRNSAAPDWADWLIDILATPINAGPVPLADRTALLCNAAESLETGPRARKTGKPWKQASGKEAFQAIGELRDEADAGGEMTARDFVHLLNALLAKRSVYDRETPFSNIMIRGTLEARSDDAELVILGGLNEGSWPGKPRPDPWLSRKMRLDSGLLLPERHIGLSAHDFQQAIAGSEVWLTRAIRSEEAPTVPSRWLSRMTNLLSGLDRNGGTEALSAMRKRGRKRLDLAKALEKVERIPPAPRPSPRPPVAARPLQLSVTGIQSLIRDPYSIYARHVLRLRPLGPLQRFPDATLRGTVFHKILERVIGDSIQDPATLNPDCFLDAAEEILDLEVPWAGARTLWRTRLGKIAEKFIDDEIKRQSVATPIFLEASMSAKFEDIGITIVGKADRIDRQPDGRLRIYDYKSGTPPNVTTQRRFDKQLLVEAAIAEQGGLTDLPEPTAVAEAIFLRIARQLEMVAAPLETEPPTEVWKQLGLLLRAYRNPGQGFTSRRAPRHFPGDYDHLARFGEWDDSTEPLPEFLE